MCFFPFVFPTESSWLAKDRRNVVHLKCASFGYEHIFLAIHQKFRTKVRYIQCWSIVYEAGINIGFRFGWEDGTSRGDFYRKLILNSEACFFT